MPARRYRWPIVVALVALAVVVVATALIERSRAARQDAERAEADAAFRRRLSYVLANTVPLEDEQGIKQSLQEIPGVPREDAVEAFLGVRHGGSLAELSVDRLLELTSAVASDSDLRGSPEQLYDRGRFAGVIAVAAPQKSPLEAAYLARVIHGLAPQVENMGKFRGAIRALSKSGMTFDEAFANITTSLREGTSMEAIWDAALERLSHQLD